MNKILLLICVGAIVAGCGQKGPLYLPDKNASVVTRPAPAAAPPTPPQGTAPTTPQSPAPAAPKPQDKKDNDAQSSNQAPH